MKLRAYIALFLYTLATSGLIIQLHFCCGGLAEIGFFGELDPCDCSHESHDCNSEKQCCDFETVYLNVDEAHKVPASTQIDELSFTGVLEHHGWSEVVDLREVDAESFPIRAGPLEHAVPAYLFHCSLVYYG